MEGRQVTILAHCLNGAPAAARAALVESTPVHPWELQVASCLRVMCAAVNGPSASQDITTMIERFDEQEPMPGYAFFRARLGLTVATLATLASTADPDAADRVLAKVAEEVIHRAGPGTHHPADRFWPCSRSDPGTSVALAPQLSAGSRRCAGCIDRAAGTSTCECTAGAGQRLGGPGAT